MQLLEPAYQALIVLGSVLFQREVKVISTKEKSKEIDAERTAKEMKFWDRICRKGILMGHAHASEHPAIVETLLRKLGVIVDKLGIHAVKHLKVASPTTFMHYVYKD